MKTVPVPWARPGSGFTFLFEAFTLTLMQDMPIRAVSDLVGEWDTRLWRVLDHYVTEASDQRSLAPVTAFGVDQVRREERKVRPELAGTRYLWLKNPQDLKVSAADRLANLRQAHRKTGRAYASKETLKEFWDQPPKPEPAATGM